MLHGGIYEQNEAEEAGRFHPYVPPCRVSTFTFTRTAECVCVHARDIFVRKRINDAIIRSLPEARSLRRRRVACFRGSNFQADKFSRPSAPERPMLPSPPPSAGAISRDLIHHFFPFRLRSLPLPRLPPALFGEG